MISIFIFKKQYRKISDNLHVLPSGVHGYFAQALAIFALLRLSGLTACRFASVGQLANLHSFLVNFLWGGV